MKVILILLGLIIINFCILADWFSKGELHRAFWEDLINIIKN